MRGIVWLLSIALLLTATDFASAADDVAICKEPKKAPDAALAACTRLLRSRRFNNAALSSIHTSRGLAFRLKNDYERAISDYNEAIRLNPKNAIAYNNRGVAQRIRNIYDPAIADLSQAIRLSPGNATSYKERGMAYRQKNELDRAIADLNQSIRLNPTDAGAYTERGIAFSLKKDYDRAIGDYSEAIRLDPKSSVAYEGRGVAFRMKKDYVRAIDDLNVAIRLSPQFAIAYNQRGIALRLKGDSDRAVADFNEAIRLAPRMAIAYSERGFAFLVKHDYDLAIGDFDQAIRLDPKLTGAYFGRGTTFNQRNEFDRAIADFSEAIRLNARFLLAYNARSFAYKRRGEFDRAVADANEAIRLNASYAPSYSARGDALREKGEIERAIADLNEALRLDPNLTPAYVHRGLAYEKKGDIGLARADFKSALEHPDTKYLTTKAALDTARERLTALGAPSPQVAALPQKPESTAPLPTTETATVVGAEVRVALVIGNGRYQNANPLPNPPNDAADIANALRRLGFEVIEGIDLDKHAMEDKVREFGHKLDRASLALFFYAGHGLQVGGKNYLVPVDAKLERPGDLAFETLNVDQVLGEMEADQRVNLVFLDACRDNPLARSLARSLGTRSTSVGSGLAAIQSAVGTMIAYSTSPDNVALDGQGRNSPFTTALLRRIATKGKDIGTVMRLVRADGLKATHNKQLPWDSSSLVGEVVLAK